MKQATGGDGRSFLYMGTGEGDPRPPIYGVGVISEAEMANPTIAKAITTTSKDLTAPDRRMPDTSIRRLGYLEQYPRPLALRTGLTTGLPFRGGPIASD